MSGHKNANIVPLITLAQSENCFLLLKEQKHILHKKYLKTAAEFSVFLV